MIQPVSFWGQLILDVDIRKKYCKSSCIKMFELGIVYFKQFRSRFAKQAFPIFPAKILKALHWDVNSKQRRSWCSVHTWTFVRAIDVCCSKEKMVLTLLYWLRKNKIMFALNILTIFPICLKSHRRLIQISEDGMRWGSKWMKQLLYCNHHFLLLVCPLLTASSSSVYHRGASVGV